MPEALELPSLVLSIPLLWELFSPPNRQPSHVPQLPSPRISEPDGGNARCECKHMPSPSCSSQAAGLAGCRELSRTRCTWGGGILPSPHHGSWPTACHFPLTPPSPSMPAPPHKGLRRGQSLNQGLTSTSEWGGVGGRAAPIFLSPLSDIGPSPVCMGWGAAFLYFHHFAAPFPQALGCNSSLPAPAD